MDIGFIGLGVMGRPMAGHLIAAGHSVYLNRVKDIFERACRSGWDRARYAKSGRQSG